MSSFFLYTLSSSSSSSRCLIILGCSQGQKRIIHQDDPASQQEIAVQMVQKSIKNTNTHYRIGDPTPSTFSVKGVANQNGKITNRKGKGKEKVEEITVSSDDDEGEEEAQAEDSDPIEYSDDDLARPQGGQPRAGPSKSTHSSMNHRKQVLSTERAGPSSDFDELGMELPGQFQRSGARAGNVSSIVSHYEAILDGTAGGGGGQKKVATSLGAKVSFEPFSIFSMFESLLLIEVSVVRIVRERRSNQLLPLMAKQTVKTLTTIARHKSRSRDPRKRRKRKMVLRLSTQLSNSL